MLYRLSAIYRCQHNSRVNAKPARRAGRPSDYLPEYADQAAKLSRLGAIDADLAEFFEVSEVTINAWKKAHPKFLKSIKSGKALVDRDIAERLIERASGSEWIEQKEVKLKRKNTRFDDKGKKIETVEEEVIEVLDLKKAAPPDTTAIIFFLKIDAPTFGATSRTSSTRQTLTLRQSLPSRSTTVSQTKSSHITSHIGHE